MTATEDLRRMLDERGVEYETDDVSDSWYEKTTWSSENNLWWTYEVSAIEELPYGTLMLLDTGSSNSMRPAQAIAATLGRGKCRPTKREGDGFEYCSECGGMLARWIDYSGKEPGFCPSCGRRVVGE